MAEMKNDSNSPPKVCPLLANISMKRRGCDYPELWQSLPDNLRNRCGVGGCILLQITLADGRNIAGAYTNDTYWSYRDAVFPQKEAVLAMEEYARKSRKSEMIRNVVES